MDDKSTHSLHEDKSDHMAHERDETPDVEGHIKTSTPEPDRAARNKTGKTSRGG